MTFKRCGRPLVFFSIGLAVIILVFGTRNEMMTVIRLMAQSMNAATTTTTTRTLEMAENQTSNVSIMQMMTRSIQSNQTNRPHDDQHPSSSSRRLCSRDELQQGAWIPTILPKAPYVPNNIKLRCYPKEHYDQEWKTWQWQPHAQASGHCTLLAWNKNAFCHLAHAFSTIAIVGDSLSWEQYASLIQLLGLKSHQTYQHRSKLLDQNHIEYACPKRNVRLLYRRDDLLQKLPHVLNDNTSSSFPQVLILNRGAHYTNDTVFLQGIHQVLQALRPWQEQCQLLQRPCHVFWRTSVPGHPSCWNFSRPVTNVTDMEAYIRNPHHYDHYLERQWNYHWYDYQHQNELALHAIEQHVAETITTTATSSSSSSSSSQHQQQHYVQFDIIDAYHINLLRPDEHRWQHNQSDCLHSCYPGKMDLYNQLLLHYLSKRQQQGKVANSQSSRTKSAKLS
jgi:hypothetical protein